MDGVVKAGVVVMEDAAAPCDNNRYDDIPDDNHGDNDDNALDNSDYDNNAYEDGESEVMADVVD